MCLGLKVGSGCSRFRESPRPYVSGTTDTEEVEPFSPSKLVPKDLLGAWVSCRSRACQGASSLEHGMHVAPPCSIRSCCVDEVRFRT